MATECPEYTLQPHFTIPADMFELAKDHGDDTYPRHYYTVKVGTTTVGHVLTCVSSRTRDWHGCVNLANTVVPIVRRAQAETEDELLEELIPRLIRECSNDD